jgi:hypothetical protein
MMTCICILYGSFGVVTQCISIGIFDDEFQIGVVHIKFGVSCCEIGIKWRVSGICYKDFDGLGETSVNLFRLDPL